MKKATDKIAVIASDLKIKFNSYPFNLKIINIPIIADKQKTIYIFLNFKGITSS